METPTVIDLTLTTSSLVDKVQDWQTVPDLRSDYFGILFNIVLSTSAASTNSTIFHRFDTKRAEWGLFRDTLTTKITTLLNSAQMPNLVTLSNLATLHGPKADISDQTKETIAEVLTTAIIDASNASIPKSTVTKKSKPWWDDNLRDLRKKMANIGRKSQNNPYL